ncbi:MAG: 3-dehydroquinate dehydratase [Solirubrobacterales bacterium]|nr:3-dehydroquinate dehydratase [Solirubrobacterales bacterium]
MWGSARIELLHGVNLDQLGSRDPTHYGSLTLTQLEAGVRQYAAARGFQLSCFQTNHEGVYVERLHAARDSVKGLILNPGAWTHYSYAIRDALELTGLPAVEVHLSDVQEREEFRRHSVIGELCVATVAGKGVDGYVEAVEILAKEMSS